jgi:hypothetical protein
MRCKPAWRSGIRRPNPVKSKLMFKFFQRRVRAKIVLGYLVLGFGLNAISQLDQINATVYDLTNRLVIEKSLVQDIDAHIAPTRLYAYKYMRAANQNDLDLFYEQTNKLSDLLIQIDRMAPNPSAEMKSHKFRLTSRPIPQPSNRLSP